MINLIRMLIVYYVKICNKLVKIMGLIIFNKLKLDGLKFSGVLFNYVGEV